jgi:hypothetical protein
VHDNRKAELLLPDLARCRYHNMDLLLTWDTAITEPFETTEPGGRQPRKCRVPSRQQHGCPHDLLLRQGSGVRDHDPSARLLPATTSQTPAEYRRSQELERVAPGQNSTLAEKQLRELAGVIV